MQRFAFIDANGLPIYSASPAIDDAYVDGDTYGAHTARLLPVDAPDDITVLATYYYKDGDWHTRIPRPGSYYNWNNTTEAWVADLGAARTAKNAQIDAAREAANETFTYAGKTFQADLKSRADLDAVNGYVSLLSGLPSGFAGSWKALDNSLLTIANMAAWILMYSAMVDQRQANFAHSETKKAAVTAASTIAAIEAITW